MAPGHVVGVRPREQPEGGVLVGIADLGLDAQRLGDRVELLSPAEMWAIDDALLTVLGLA